MKEVGPGVMEIRIHVRGEWRVIYVAKFTAAVYVLHAFEKKGLREVVWVEDGVRRSAKAHGTRG